MVAGSSSSSMRPSAVAPCMKGVRDDVYCLFRVEVFFDNLNGLRGVSHLIYVLCFCTIV
jgi:hypothetical protein